MSPMPQGNSHGTARQKIFVSLNSEIGLISRVGQFTCGVWLLVFIEFLNVVANF
jgi:hypothetical protein